MLNVLLLWRMKATFLSIKYSNFTTTEHKSPRVVKLQVWCADLANPLTMPPAMYSLRLFICINHFPDVSTAGFYWICFLWRQFAFVQFSFTVVPSYFAVIQLVNVSKISPIFRGRAKIIFISFSSTESTFQILWFAVVWSPWSVLELCDSL